MSCFFPGLFLSYTIRVCNSNSKKKVFNVLVKFSTLEVTLVEAPVADLLDLHHPYTYCILQLLQDTRLLYDFHLSDDEEQCHPLGVSQPVAMTFTIFLSNHADAVM